MTLLTLLLLANAVLHGVIIGRFGIEGNGPPAVFGLVYAGLALAAFLGWPHTPLAVLRRRSEARGAAVRGVGG